MACSVDEFRGKRISVIGAARSGIAAAHVLTQLGAIVTLSDSQAAEKVGVARVAEASATGATAIFGAGIGEALPEGTELVVTSPGVPKSALVLQEAVRRRVPVWSEIELAYRLTDAPIAATTGTNGKTTTTLLLTEMLQAAGQQAIVAGNVSADEIKRTLVEAAEEATPDSVIVAEISSFQLEWVERFAPKVAILTNVTPDHLNRHASFEEYAATKARIFAAQPPDAWAILNHDNPAAREIGESGLPGRVCWFTREGSPPDSGPTAWLHNGILTVRLEDGHSPVALLHSTDLPPTLPGAHSIENALAAGAAALALGADAEAIAEALLAFKGVAHRMEFVAEVGGVRYINNSMCTNVAAAVSSLNALMTPAVVIAGGADKGLDFAPLTEPLKARAKHLVLIGAAADKMEQTFRAGGFDRFSRAGTLEEAVQMARKMAEPGETVLFSPACASFDMFTDFEARGAAFRRLVHTLKEPAA